MGGNVSAAELMANLARLGIRLEADANRLLYWPRSAVTPDLAERVKAHKGELLAILRPSVEAQSITCARCRSVEFRDTPIHGGHSVRRDCARCGRFIDFPKWYTSEVQVIDR